ncbi:phage antirepressor N-terminal domain-containing protein [Acinetobacter junii]|uniref:phage antirepressor N-terminal domain-containing protein n=1 Tax=Acinetobacter junii TaxID=40215 RepID=UPI000F671208|nr:phage antirepressor N-terminal domain-containing protein [Acinetobacter junii]QXR26640.1 phage antirepressor N-terminal domain-containing protein [Acinetobacter junii]
MDTKPKIIKFNNQQIPVYFVGDKPFVAMKQICENIGLQWEAQLKRIKRNHVLNSSMSIMDMVAQDGRIREVICLPFSMLNGWLMGVDANKVRLEIKDTLIKYQLECYDVLYNHFMPKPQKQIDMALYVSKELHNKVALKYHRMFRQYDDMIDHLRKQVDEMQCKCRRYDFRMKVNAKEIQSVAVNFGTSVARIKQILMDELLLEERNPYVETNKTVLNVTDRGKKLEFLFLQSEIVDGDIQDIIMITDDGIQYLAGLLERKIK